MRFTKVVRNITGAVGQRMREARELLGVENSATNKDIHQAYLQLGKQYHPDMSASPDAAKFIGSYSLLVVISSKVVVLFLD